MASDNLYITRYDHKRMHGYLVRFTLMSGHRVSKMFYDSRYGGKRLTLLAARRFRDGMMAVIRPSQNPLPRTQYARNTSGVIGVAPLMNGDKVTGWKAYISDPPGTQNVTKFPYSEYGEEAKDMAVRHRRREERRVRDQRGRPTTRKSG